MDEPAQFKQAGNLSLTVPLAQGFHKILCDFIRLAASKSGFDRENSSRIAEKISAKVFGKVPMTPEVGNSQPVEVSLVHRPGQIIIKTEIVALSFSEEEEFKSA
jgi:hypothetical protein